MGHQRTLKRSWSLEAPPSTILNWHARGAPKPEAAEPCSPEKRKACEPCPSGGAAEPCSPGKRKAAALIRARLEGRLSLTRLGIEKRLSRARLERR
eukprot:3573499-Pleurochrysis_carterae.AAC.2